MHEVSGKRGARNGTKAKAAVKLAMIVRALFGAAMVYRKAKLAKASFAVAKASGKAAAKGVKGAAAAKGMKGAAAVGAKRYGRCRKCGGARHRGPCAMRRPVRALGAMSVGATALGAFAVGALAIGAVAIRRLAVKRGDIERLEIGELKVKRLQVDELLVREETRPAQAGAAPPVQPHPPAGEPQPPPPPPGEAPPPPGL